MIVSNRPFSPRKSLLRLWTDLVPPYLDIPEFKKDLNLARQLKNLLLILEPSVEKISDTYLAAGYDAFLAARKLYRFVKTASDSGAPGSDTIAAELKKRYLRRRSSSQQNNGSQEEENQESNA